MKRIITDRAEKFVTEKLSAYRSELERVLNGGDITEYNFCPSDEKDDVNFENRLRLSLAILYNSDGLDVEVLSCILLNEEAKLLEAAKYGGVTETSIFLTTKLLQYEKSYKKLFKHVRRANFDCWFGYDVQHTKKFLHTLSDWHNQEWEYIFYLLNDDESSKKFSELNGGN